MLYRCFAVGIKDSGVSPRDQRPFALKKRAIRVGDGVGFEMMRLIVDSAPKSRGNQVQTPQENFEQPTHSFVADDGIVAHVMGNKRETREAVSDQQ